MNRSHATVRAYRPGVDGDALVELVDAPPNETVRMLDDGAVEAKEGRELLRTETDEEGRFQLTFDVDEPGDTTIVDEKSVHNYEGTPIELDVRLETVPGETVPDPDPVQIRITVFNPVQRGIASHIADTEIERGGAAFEYCFSKEFWCSVREQFGAWVVCGRAWDCEEEQARAGLTVRARDSDIIEHEVLGTATTDANGQFRIYFSRADFERTPSPFPDIELSSKGPDLFFEVDDQEGTALYQEPSSRGRESDREDAGPCTTVELCVDLPPITDGPGGYSPIPQFTHVGQYSITTDIDSSGYATGADPLAFTGTLPLKGVLPHGGTPTPTEYRFLIENLDTGQTTTLDASAIEPTRIGTLQKYTTSGGTTTLDHEPYYVNNPNAQHNVTVKSPEGWIEVPREDDLGTPQNPGSGAFARNTGLLVRFDTQTILDEVYDLTTPSVHEAGESLDPNERSTEHTFAITFERRTVGGSTVHRDTLSKIVLSNTAYEQHRHPSWAADDATLPGVVMLDIKEFMESDDGCAGLSEKVDARVTAYNPHIDDVRVWIEGPGTGSAHDSTLQTTNGEVATTETFNTSGLDPCAYILWLRVSYRLTNGRHRIDPDHDHIGFCLTDDSA